MAVILVAAFAAVAAALYITSTVEPGPNSRPQLGLFLIPAGTFTVAGTWFGWGWFFRMGKARTVSAMFGRSGARVFYALLGGALIGGGLGLLLV